MHILHLMAKDVYNISRQHISIPTTKKEAGEDHAYSLLNFFLEVAPYTQLAELCHMATSN
jgi:hypothetical protein